MERRAAGSEERAGPSGSSSLLALCGTLVSVLWALTCPHTEGESQMSSCPRVPPHSVGGCQHLLSPLHPYSCAL